MFLDYLHAFIGLHVFIGMAVLFSRNRKKINWRLVGVGVGLQILVGVLVIKVDFIRKGFSILSSKFVELIAFSTEGAKFIFGGLALNSYNFPLEAHHELGFIFAFQVLPILIFFSSLSAGLYYLGVLQWIVRGIAWVMARTMGLSGPESLSAAGNIFLGQTEAPLLVKPFIKNMSKSELMCLMTGGMSTLAGSVLATYISFLGGSDPAETAKFASYLLVASIMNAPAGIVMAKILVPETETVNKSLKVNPENVGVNLIDALASGASDGLKLALNVGAMLLAFIAIIALLNASVGGIGEWVGLNDIIKESTGGQFEALSMEYIFGQLFRVFSFAMGVPWEDSLQVGSLLGVKTAVNEFIAYTQLAEMKHAGTLQPKSVIISTYALCGFANFSSIAIQIGGIGGMAPSRQGDISKLGLISLLGATLACMSTGAVAGALIGG